MVYQIKDVKSREILGSRANPTAETEILLESGVAVRAAVPSGASTGQLEALELRDRDPARFGRKGVQKTVENINTVIRDCLIGMNASGIAAIDAAMLELDGTKDKSNLGANAILAVFLAAAQTAAKIQGVLLYRSLDGAASDTLPIPMMSVLNGGTHAANNVDIQEFMIMFVGASSFREGLRMCAEMFHALAFILKGKNLSISVGDESGHTPNLGNDGEAVRHLLCTVEAAGYRPYDGFILAIDTAVSEWKSGKGTYPLLKSRKHYATDELVSFWGDLVSRYPITSLGDTLDEEDREGWKKPTARLGGKLQLAGDDLFVTDTERLQKGIENNCGNPILIKLDRIGSSTEALNTIKMAHSAGYAAVVSHRSSETKDATIAGLTVAMSAGRIKTGAPSHNECAAKYNQLLRIEEDLGNSTRYPGKGCYDCKQVIPPSLTWRNC